MCEHAAADNGGGQGHVARSPHGPAKQIQHADRYRAAECHVRIGEGSRQRLALSAQRVGAVAWPFLLSLPAVNPIVTVPTMFHGRVPVLPVVAIVAAIQEGQVGFNFSKCLLRDSKSSYICNSGRALRPRRARPANNSFTELKFNQPWLSES